MAGILGQENKLPYLGIGFFDLWLVASYQRAERLLMVGQYFSDLSLLNIFLNAIWLAVCKGCLSLIEVSVLSSLVRYQAVL